MNIPSFYALKANDPNADEGPRSASVITFSGDTNDSMVKELTQNSLDARAERNGDLEIKINVLDIVKTDIPDFETFQDKLMEMRDYYASINDQYTRFFETAFKSLEGDKIKVLVFEDFLTKGLIGDDKDKKGTFRKCVNDENISGGKESDSLGNHGIGKNSVFGYSSIQTVFYSSLNTQGEYKFKGVSKLGTYDDKDGIHRSNRMFYGKVITGGDQEEVQLISELKDIPRIFRRINPGLSQFVLGAEVGDDWETNIQKAFLINYWFLFENGKIKVTVGDVQLNKENYEEYAVKLFNGVNSDLNPLPYIKAYRSSQAIEKTIYKIGNVKLFLLEAEEGDIFPNRVLYLRDGMKIKTGSLGVKGLPTSIAGVIYCTNSVGNSILGAMEPHAHDDFFPALVEKKGAPNDVGIDDAKKIINEIERFKTDSIRKIKNKYAEAVSNVEIVDKLFEGIMLGSQGKKGVGKVSETENESFDVKNKDLEMTVSFSSVGSNSIVTGEDEVSDGDGPESGIGEGGKGLRKGNGKKTGNKGGGVVDPGPRKRKNKRNVASRFFLTQRTGELSEYKIVLKSETNYGACNVIIGQIGDNRSGSGGMGSELREAKDANGNIIPFQLVLSSDGSTSGYELVGVMLTGKDTIDIKVTEKTLSAFTIIETK